MRRSDDSDSSPLSTRAVWLLGATAAAAAITALYAYGAHGFPLTEPDEARYAEIGREMLARGDWVTPHLNFVKYFEKPPLVYWATAAAFGALGVSELAARLPSLVSGLVTIALTVGLARRMYGPSTALLALPIIALGPLFGFLAQTLTLDMSLTLFMTLAMAAVWFGWTRTPPDRPSTPPGSSAGPAGRPPPPCGDKPPEDAERLSPVGDSLSGGSSPAWLPGARHATQTWYRVAFVATALAVLVKGPVAALLVAGSALLFLALHGGWRAVRPALDWRGFALALAVAVPWFVLVSWRNPEFVHFFVVDQHIARYLWTSEHGEPIWFFAPVIALALGPWGLMLLLDPALWRGALAPRTWSAPTRFLVIWAAVIVVFFSLSTSKLLTYVLPAMPPLAILAARAIAAAFAQGRTAPLSRLAWLFLVGGPVLSLCGALVPHLSTHWRTPLLAPYLIAGGVPLVATGWLTRRALQRGRPYAALAVLALGWCAVFAVAVSGRGVANDYRALGLAARAAMAPEDRLVLYRRLVHGIGFYAGRRTIMVGHPGELKFGSGQGAQRAWFWSGDADLRREWAAPGRLFLVINRKDLDAFRPPLDPPPLTVAAKDKKVLVVNR